MLKIGKLKILTVDKPAKSIPMLIIGKLKILTVDIIQPREFLS